MSINGAKDKGTEQPFPQPVKTLPAQGLQGDLGQKFPVAHKVAGFYAQGGDFVQEGGAFASIIA